MPTFIVRLHKPMVAGRPRAKRSASSARLLDEFGVSHDAVDRRGVLPRGVDDVTGKHQFCGFMNPTKRARRNDRRSPDQSDAREDVGRNALIRGQDDIARERQVAPPDATRDAGDERPYHECGSAT